MRFKVSGAPMLESFFITTSDRHMPLALYCFSVLLERDPQRGLKEISLLASGWDKFYFEFEDHAELQTRAALHITQLGQLSAPGRMKATVDRVLIRREDETEARKWADLTLCD